MNSFIKVLNLTALIMIVNTLQLFLCYQIISRSHMHYHNVTYVIIEDMIIYHKIRLALRITILIYIMCVCVCLAITKASNRCFVGFIHLKKRLSSSASLSFYVCFSLLMWFE